tara:strand:- start:196 stop:1548 length:1353 start_codon:yes stop_codon:yes gene_type:complete
MADTDLFESAQALFCSAADLIGIKDVDKILNVTTYPTYKSFISIPKHKAIIKEAAKQTNVDVSFKRIEEFLTKSDSWYKSSIKIAKAVITDIKKIDPDFNLGKKGYESGGNFHWFRGDSNVMGSIFELYKLANESASTNFKWGGSKKVNLDLGFTSRNMNKWNPADIFYANKTAVKAIEQEKLKVAKLGGGKFYSFDNGTLKKKKFDDGLNVFIARLVDNGDLLPLSLKKQTGTVILKAVNFDPKDKDDLLDSVEFTGTTKWKKFSRLGKSGDIRDSWKAIVKGEKTETRDIQLFFKSDMGTGLIKIRHDPSGSGRFVAEAMYTGAKAKAGSIATAKDLATIWSVVDSTSANEFITAYNKGDTAFDLEKKKIGKDKDYLRKQKGGGTNQYDHYMAVASAELITNKTIPPILKFFTKGGEANKVKQNLFVRLMFQAITSRSPRSSRFVIAK